MPMLRLTLLSFLSLITAGSVWAQVPKPGEVRQLVTFTWQPDRAAEALALYRNAAIPLYQQTPALQSFRAFREVESPVPLDLIVVSSYAGMAGMDLGNAQLRAQAERGGGTGIGALYRRISALSTGHTDEFVEMLPALGTGDASSKRLTAFIWVRLTPGRQGAYEEALAGTVVPWEQSAGIVSATGRFLLSDGWHVLRLLAFDSLGAYQAYWARLRAETDYAPIERLIDRQREVIVATVPDLSVR